MLKRLESEWELVSAWGLARLFLKDLVSESEMVFCLQQVNPLA